ncbi:LysE family transporter [Serratia marcescens]|uniref:LysE family transporter n=1 Tax=Serratia marcescens TaxID=615 RepID=A0A939SRC1_SERMA|nr:LysE family transporter [Serratia marcescens]
MRLYRRGFADPHHAVPVYPGAFLGAIYLLFLGAKILYATFVQKAQAQQQQIEGGHSILQVADAEPDQPESYSVLRVVLRAVHRLQLRAHGLSFTILALILEAVSFIYMSTLIFSGAMLAHFFNHRERLGEARQRPDRPAVLGFATRLATLSSIPPGRRAGRGLPFRHGKMTRRANRMSGRPKPPLSR